MADLDPCARTVVADCWQCGDATEQTLTPSLDGDELVCSVCETFTSSQRATDAVERASRDYRFFIQ